VIDLSKFCFPGEIDTPTCEAGISVIYDDSNLDIIVVADRPMNFLALEFENGSIEEFDMDSGDQVFLTGTGETTGLPFTGVRVATECASYINNLDNLSIVPRPDRPQ